MQVANRAKARSTRRLRPFKDPPQRGQHAGGFQIVPVRLQHRDLPVKRQIAEAGGQYCPRLPDRFGLTRARTLRQQGVGGLCARLARL